MKKKGGHKEGKYLEVGGALGYSGVAEGEISTKEGGGKR